MCLYILASSKSVESSTESAEKSSEASSTAPDYTTLPEAEIAALTTEVI
jgi:hypothetical protein